MRLPRRTTPGSPAVIVTVDPTSPALSGILRSFAATTLTVDHARYRGTVRLLSSGNGGITVELLDDLTRLQPLVSFLSYDELRSVTEQPRR